MQSQKSINSGRFARLTELKQELYAKFFEMTEELGRLEADMEWERRALFEVTVARKSEYEGQIESAKALQISRAALSRRDPAEHLKCFASTRVQMGGKIFYPVAARERHWQNAVSGKSPCDCASYKQKPETPLKIVQK
jgi:hypothetical protein